MRELPILFSTEMIRALLDGRKFQTRRIVRPQPDEGEGEIGVGIFNPTLETRGGEMYPGPDTFGAIADSGEFCVRCPYGQAGDLLYVRETWQDTTGFAGEDGGYVYKATDPDWDNLEGWTWRPSLHMPKDAARIWLQVESVGEWRDCRR